GVARSHRVVHTGDACATPPDELRAAGGISFRVPRAGRGGAETMNNSFVNNVKTVMLLGAMVAIFAAIGAIWGRQGMIVGLIFGGAMNVVAWFFSDRIAIAAMQGREATRENAPE